MSKEISIFDFEIENSNAVNYGKFYWGVVLNDGRYMFFHADRVVIDDSNLVAVRDIATPNEHDGQSQVTLCLAPGQWLTYFAASAMTGEPVCVDNLLPKEKTSK